MKERPILFSGTMVRALLAGTKTQTRRTIKPALSRLYSESRDNDFAERFCPYGVPGDRLWVKETFARISDGEKEGTVYRADPDGENGIDRDTGECWKPSIFMPRWLSRITLELTAVRVERLNDISEAEAKAEGIRPWYSAPHVGPYCWMLDGDSKEKPFYDGRTGWHPSPTAQDAYRRLWESINGPGSWALNPWVWVLEFRKL